MNMISHLIDQYIHNDEKKLAFKISIASFFILITILISIIGASYFYEYRELRRDIYDMSNAMYANPMKEDSLHKQNNPLFFPRN